MSDRGFTLLELLLAVTLLAALTALAGSGLATGFDGSQRLARRVAAVDDLRIAQSVLRRLLTAAQPLSPDGGRAVAFAGTAEGADFMAPMPASLGGGLGVFRLQLDRDARLLLLRKPIGAGFDGFDFKGAGSSLLLDRVARLRLEYWGPDGTGKSVWRTDWREADALPRLVRIAVQVAGQGPAWPELLIAPRLERGER